MIQHLNSLARCSSGCRSHFFKGLSYCFLAPYPYPINTVCSSLKGITGGPQTDLVQTWCTVLVHPVLQHVCVSVYVCVNCHHLKNWASLCKNPDMLQEGFTELGQMEEYSRSCWDVWHAFIQGRVVHIHCKLHVPLHVELTLHGRKSQLPYILHAHRAGKKPRYYTTELHSVHVSSRKAKEPFVGPSLEAMRTLLTRPILKVMGNCFP